MQAVILLHNKLLYEEKYALEGTRAVGPLIKCLHTRAKKNVCVCSSI